MASDKELQQNVRDALSWTPNLNSAHIGITAHDGVVTLTGNVDAYSEKLDAEHAVRRVKGARAVANEIQIKLKDWGKRDDEDIAKAAIGLLKWEANVPKDSIEICVSSGWVTLSGEVELYFQKEMAARRIRRLTGVVGLTDETIVKPPNDTVVAASDIESALDRTSFDTTRVKVTAKDGKVTLTGTVDTLRDLEDASELAMAAKGVTSFENGLAIAERWA